MTNSFYPAIALAASLCTLAPSTGNAHGDSGGGGGTLLPAGITLVGVDYDVIRFNEISDARLTALALQGVEEVHSLKTIAVPALTLGYGVTHDLTLSVRLPYLSNEEIRETDPDSGSVAARGGVHGFGDVSFTGTYRFLDDPASGLEAALILGVKAPTGPTGRVDNFGERFETEHQPSSGSWDGIFGATLSRELGLTTLSANAHYQLSGEGTAQTTLGDRCSYGIAASYRLWSSAGPHNHDHASHLGANFDGMMHHGGPDHDNNAGHAEHTHTDVFHGTALDLLLGLNGEWSGKVESGGDVNQNTGGSVMFVTPGIKLSVDNWTGYINAGIPVSQSLNGIQSDLDWRLTTGASVQF